MKSSLALGLCLAGGAWLLAVGGQAIRSTAAPLAAPGAAAEFSLVGEFTQGGWARGVAPNGTVALTFDGKPMPMAADRTFFLAFDRDAGPVATLAARLADGRSLNRAIAVSRRAWKLEYIPIGPKPGALPDPEFVRRRAAEVAQINAARAIDSHSQGWRQHFIWPVHGRISSPFGSQRIYRGTPGAYHSGVDIAAGTGTPIVAPADGVVILAAQSPFTLEGNLLMVDHGMGLNSAFLHCSKLLVHSGEAVKQGQVIARIGMTGRATGPHLHWSLKWRDARLDPMLFAGPMR